MRTLHTLSYFLFALLICVLITSCSSQITSEVRKVTYPPDFTYVEKSDLRSEMEKLSHQMILLERALSQTHQSNELAEEIQREEVLDSLREMGRIASRINKGDAPSNHPFMENYMKDFISKVDKARGAASIQPPRYYYAGKVAGGCTNCHRVNR